MPKKIKPHKRSEYIAAIIFNLVAVYIVNNLENWNVPFLADGWTACLWALNISIIAGIIGNFVLIFLNFPWFRALIQMVLNIISLVVLYTFYVIFPFDLSSGWELVIKIILLIGMVGTIIGTAVELGQILLVIKDKK